MRTLRVIRVVAVSPGDVDAERKRLANVVDELNRRVASHHGCQLVLWRWETDAHPGLHLEGPQGLIDNVMRIHDADVVVGIFWNRIGTPTKGAQSGTAHELRQAWDAWQAKQRPQVMVYFCERKSRPRDAAEASQLQQLLRFRDELPAEHMWWRYVTVADFERAVRDHLTHFVQTLPPEIERDVAMAQAPPERPGAGGPMITNSAQATWSEDDLRELLAIASDPELARARAEMILDRALNYRQCVRFLHDSLGVPDDVMAAVTGVQPDQVREWRSPDADTEEPRSAEEQAIERLRTISLLLITSGTFIDLRGVGVWLRSRREPFGWRAPFEVLAEDADGFAKVIAEAEKFVRPGAGLSVAGFGPPRRTLLLEDPDPEDFAS